MINRLFPFAFLLLIAPLLWGTHLVGGYISYEYLRDNNDGNSSYVVEMHLYRDCFNGSQNARELDIPISVFRDGVNYMETVVLLPSSRRELNLRDNNPCLVDAPDFCVEEEVYDGIINLPNQYAHTLVFQRCCRNEIIDNVPNPGDKGSTFVTDVPSFNSIGENSTPVFDKLPPLTLCTQALNQANLQAIDSDGDSLVYTLCAPYDYPFPNNNFPRQAVPPPYFELPFSPPSTPNDPIPSNPITSINSQTGNLSVTPTNDGEYVVGFCVEEYRNGVLINTTRRDFQVKSAICDPVIETAIQNQDKFCEGLEVNFSNGTSGNIQVNNFKWDFGDLSTLADTSNARNPIYEYQNAGTYQVTLISNPGYPCSDTTSEEFKVAPVLNPGITRKGSACRDFNYFDFFPSGSYESYADFKWDFGLASNVSISTTDTVRDVSFAGNGPFSVELIVNQDGCSDTVLQSVGLFPNPTADFTFDTTAGCYPLPVSFTNLSSRDYMPEFEWNFGDGNSSTLENPNHTYNENGYFDVSLIMRTTEDCLDTVLLEIDSAIHTSLDLSTNEIKFAYTPNEICPSFEVDFLDSSIYEGNADYYWDFGDGELSQEQNPTHVYTDTGSYDIGLLLIPTDRCIDTLVKTIPNAITVLPEPSSIFSISDSALPKNEATFQFDGRASQDYVSSRFLLEGREISNSDFYEYQFQDTGHFDVTHIVTNSFGCSDSSLREVFVYDVFEFIIPNVFTPNGDRINDFFAPKASGIYDYLIQIFNRHGKKVFSSNSLNIHWDGRVNGKKAKTGVYFYLIKIRDFRGEIINYEGTCTLLND